MDTLPDDLWHFALADRFHASPVEVVEEWDEEMVLDALELMAAEARDRKLRRLRAGNR